MVLSMFTDMYNITTTNFRIFSFHEETPYPLPSPVLSICHPTPMPKQSLFYLSRYRFDFTEFHINETICCLLLLVSFT